MAVRDPETGQFVSADQVDCVDWGDITTLGGAMSFTIAAADLDGSSHTTNATGDDAALIDLSNNLSEGEVFVPYMIRTVATLSPGTTATTEGFASLDYGVDFEDGDFDGVWNASSPFLGAPADRTITGDGAPISVNGTLGAGSNGSSKKLLYGSVVAEPSWGDDAQGQGAGADLGEYKSDLHLVRDLGLDLDELPRLDDDDFVYSPFELGYDGIDDHAISGSIRVWMFGIVAQTEEAQDDCEIRL